MSFVILVVLDSLKHNTYKNVYDVQDKQNVQCKDVLKTQFLQQKEPIPEEKAYKQKIRGCVSGLKGVPGFIT